MIENRHVNDGTCQIKPKRKRKVLTLEDKLVILDRLSKRERQVDLALEFGLIAVMHVLCNPDFTYLNISHIREGVGPI